MSERHPNFSDYHRQGEQEVKAAVRNSNGEYEHVGREEDPRVAEAMAYAAKFSIDNTLRTMEKGEPNGLLVTANGDLTGAPGVMTEDYSGKQHTTSYKSLKTGVEQGHHAANIVQVNYYKKIAESKDMERRAKLEL